MKIGHATFKGNKLVFDKTGWEIVCVHARKQNKSVQFVVIQALKRYLKTKERLMKGGN